VQQVLSGVHWAGEPLSRLCHMVSNVHLLHVRPWVAAPAEVTVKCRFLIYRNRVETETDLLVGKREDVLRRVDGQWRICQRKVILDQNVLLAKNLTFFSKAAYLPRRKAVRAAKYPHRPCTPPPGGVEDEQMYSPGTGVAYGTSRSVGRVKSWRKSWAPPLMSPPM